MEWMDEMEWMSSTEEEAVLFFALPAVLLGCGA